MPLLQVLVFAVFLDHGRNFAVRLGGLLILAGVLHDLRRRQRLGQLLVASFDLFQAVKHGYGLRSMVYGRRSSHGLRSTVYGRRRVSRAPLIQRIDKTGQAACHRGDQLAQIRQFPSLKCIVAGERAKSEFRVRTMSLAHGTGSAEIRDPSDGPCLLQCYWRPKPQRAGSGLLIRRAHVSGISRWCGKRAKLRPWPVARRGDPDNCCS